LAAEPGSPVERDALTGPFLQRLAVGSHGVFKLCRPGLALSEPI
jgi:hypothetical protein